MARRRRFARTRRGALEVKLFPQEVDLLVRTARDVRAVVEAPPEGEIRDRLYPRAYLDPTEEDAQTEYDALVHGELVDERRAALDTVVATLEGARPAARGLVALTLSPEQEMQWLTAVNDARLVIGTVLGVTEDEHGEYEADDPRFEFGLLYAFLTDVHVDLVELLLDELGDRGTDGDGTDGDGTDGAPGRDR